MEFLQKNNRVRYNNRGWRWGGEWRRIARERLRRIRGRNWEENKIWEEKGEPIHLYSSSYNSPSIYTSPHNISTVGSSLTSTGLQMVWITLHTETQPDNPI